MALEAAVAAMLSFARLGVSAVTSSVSLVARILEKSYDAVLDTGCADVFRAAVLTGLLFMGGAWWWKRKARELRVKEYIFIGRRKLRGSGVMLEASEEQNDMEGATESLGAMTGEVHDQKGFHDMLKGKASGWSKFLRLTEDGRAHYVSIQEYFCSLMIPAFKDINLRRILVTIAGNMEWDMVLPLVGAAPHHIAQTPTESVVGGMANNMDPLVYMIVDHMLENALSPVTISAISLTAHRTAQSLTTIQKFDPMAMMQKGFDGDWDELLGCEQITCPFDFNVEFLPLVEKVFHVVEAHDAAAREAHQYVPVEANYLPGLFWGATKESLEFRESPEERARSIVLTVLFNRLSCNLCSVENGAYKTPFIVMFTLGATGEDGEKERHSVTTVSEWMEVLMQNSDYKITVKLHSLFTSFSKSLCVQDLDGKFYDIPLGVPMRTGMTALDSSDIIVPMCHAGVVLTVEGPLFGEQGSVSSEFFQNIGSFTGWHAYRYRTFPWHLQSERWHEEYADDWTPEHELELIRSASILSVVENIAVREDDLFAGGYGYLGVCLDSVAVCQYAVMKKTSIFPLLLSGQPRNLMIAVAKRLGKQLVMHSNENIRAPYEKQNFVKLENAVMNVVRAMINLATDIDIPPMNLNSACERLVQTMPDKSIFSLVAESKAKALELGAHSERNFYDDKGELKQPKLSKDEVLS